MGVNAVNELVNSLVQRLEPRPVLIDVGASAGVPPVWAPIARQSVYVGFDPDLREMRTEDGGKFHQSFVINEAVTADPGPDGKVTFLLTRAPQCSSTLPPDAEKLANYFGSERFAVERQAKVAATTLDAALARLKLDRADWIKLDTQGTDLRLFNSLSPTVRDRVLAVDAEPGLRGAYIDEDLFGDLHSTLVRQGFWCAQATVKGMPRVRPATLATLIGEKADAMKDGTFGAGLAAAARGFPICPGWVECRYLRTLESMAAISAGKREYVLLWTFAQAAGQPGFAGDVAVEYAQRFGQDADAKAIADASAAQLKALSQSYQQRKSGASGLGAKVRRKIGRVARKLGLIDPGPTARSNAGGTPSVA